MHWKEQIALAKLGLVLDKDHWNVELGKNLYTIGVTQLENCQHSSDFWPIMDEEVAGASWGHGIFELNSDGTLGKELYSRWDSSD